jgi:Tfp pilus assembly protein PilN
LDAIKINLASFEYQDKRLSYTVMLVIAAIVLIISGLSIRAGLNAQADIKEFERNVTEQEQTMLKRQQIKQVPRLKDGEIESIKNNVNFINGIIYQHAYPYDRLLDSLEVSVPKGVVLSTFGMSKDFTKVMLNGKADTMNMITQFVNNLNNSAIYKNSNILNLSVSQENNSQKESASMGPGITFEVESAIVKDRMWMN